MNLTKEELAHIIREEFKAFLEERCQKGYKTHDTQKTKEIFGKDYRNCVKAEEGLDEEKEDLRTWFNRKGEKGSKGGWVDCNAPDGKGGYKSCSPGDGKKRKRYPACRPTPARCKDPGKGTKWGKKSAKRKKK